MVGVDSKIYRTKAMEALESFLRMWSPHAPHCILLCGPIGVGKTFTVEYVARELGMEHVYIEDEEEDILNAITTSRSWTGSKILVHLDRPLLWMSSTTLSKIVQNTRNPIVIEASSEECKYYQYLNCPQIAVDPPPKTWIVQQIRESKIVDKPKFEAVSDDVRQSLLLAYGSEGYGRESWGTAIEKFFKQGDASELDPSHLPVLLDTGLKLYYGRELYQFISLLIVADLTKRMEVLKGLKPTFKYTVPSLRYYEKLKVLKEQEGTEK